MRLWIGVAALALLLLLIGAVAWLDGGLMKYPMPGPIVAARSNATLTAAACNAEEKNRNLNLRCLALAAPIGAYAPYRRCGGYIESERVGASRIACSKPELLEAYFQFGEGRTAYREFRRACRAHDFCYLHSRATYDPKRTDFEAQQRCDSMLLADAIRDCRLLFPGKPDYLRKCRWAAMATYTGVRTKGADYFAKWNQAACDYEPGAHGARDQVVSGRFIKGAPEAALTIVQDAGGASVTFELVAFTESGRPERRAVLEKLSPSSVAVADGDQACTSAPWNGEGRSCPVSLAEAGLTAADWLRFAPVVLDSDGDGADEILLVSLIPEAGLVFTHLRVTSAPEGALFEAPAAFIAFNGSKEFWSASRGAISPLSDDRAIQMLSHEFVPVRRTPEGQCASPSEQDPEDLILLGGRAEEGMAAIAHKIYRFTFDQQSKRWRFHRDGFVEDRHKMRYCDKEFVGSFSQGTRLQYPAIAVHGPLKCAGRTIYGETLSAIVREKCPSSSITARAGELNDIDLINYRMNPAYNGESGTDEISELESARVSWQPVIWNEAADPVMTSRAARSLGVMLVSTYTGGTNRLRYPLINVLRADQRTEQATKEAWRERQPDTLGITPVQYAIFESNRFSEVQTWNTQKFGDPAIFYHIPSVLAPFWIDGSPGLSLVMFANRASFERGNVARPVETGSPQSDIVKRGTLQILITPLADKANRVGDVRWLECPIPVSEELMVPQARPTLRWRSDFLYQEPVLPGMFFMGEKGGLAIAYRTSEGRIGFTTLQNRPNGDQRDAWWLGEHACVALSADKPDGSAPDRHVWMMRLN
jgi:hypothetical protein